MRKCKCGNDVANNARACPKCGHRFTSGITKVVAGLFAFCFVIAMIAVIANSGNDVAPTPQAPRQSPSQPATAKQVTSTGNVAHDRLMALPAREQASNLA